MFSYDARITNSLRFSLFLRKKSWVLFVQCSVQCTVKTKDQEAAFKDSNFNYIHDFSSSFSFFLLASNINEASLLGIRTKSDL